MKLTANQKFYIVLVVALHIVVIAYYFRPNKPKLDVNNRPLAVLDNVNLGKSSSEYLKDITTETSSTTSEEIPVEQLLGTDKPYKLNRVLDGLILVSLPESLVQLTDEQLKQKYTEQTTYPLVEFTSEQADIAYQIDFYDEEDIILGDDLNNFISAFEQLVKFQYPTATWNRREVVRVNDRDFAVISFSVNNGNESFTSFMTFTKMGVRYMATTFLYPIDQEAIWGGDGQKILDNIEISY